MKYKQTVKLIGACASIALLTFSAVNAWAEDSDSVITMTMTVPTATVATPTPMFLGAHIILQHAVDTTSMVLAPDGTLTPEADPGPGNARILDSTGAPTAMLFRLTAALPQVDMSFQIGDPGVATGAFDGVPVTMTHASSGTAGTLTVDTWTCQVAAVVAGDTQAEVLAGFDGSTGLATLTTGEESGGSTGVADINCGATITTVAASGAYEAGAYSGDIRVSVNY